MQTGSDIKIKEIGWNNKESKYFAMTFKGSINSKKNKEFLIKAIEHYLVKELL